MRSSVPSRTSHGALSTAQAENDNLHREGTASYMWVPATGAWRWQSDAAAFADAPLGIAHQEAFLALIHPDDLPRYLKRTQLLLSDYGACALDYRLRIGGGEFWVRDFCAHVAASGGDPERLVGMMAPTRRPLREAEEDFALTEGPRVFLHRVDRAIHASLVTQKMGVVMLVAIENLAMLIDGYGHEPSERVMRELMRLMTEVLPPGAVIERVQRDQFGVLIENCSHTKTEMHAKDILRCLTSFDSKTPEPIHVVPTIGSVDFPRTVASAADALDRALIALKSVTGSDFRTYQASREQGEHSREQMEMASYLRQAILNKRLRLAFQPIIEAKSGRIVHYECLLRLIDGEGKIASAGMLIPVAERMGLIGMIDELVLELVVEELVRDPHVSLAFNVSSLTIDNAGWFQRFTEIIKEHPHITSRMVVEVTETAAQRDLRDTAYFVANLQAMGCQVALDDFGSGYTSFRQLKALSVDMIKIDGSFVRDLIDNADNRFFVKTLLDFTNAFGLKSVAECVETGETAKLLMELGVNYIQGYYFGRAVNYRPWREDGEYSPE